MLAPIRPRPLRSAPRPVPRHWLMTDARLAPAAMLMIAARRLPPRSAIVIRPHALGPVALAPLVRALRRIARARRHLLLWGGRGRQPGVDGIHRRGLRPRAVRFHSSPVHNRREAMAARAARVDAALISPIFATRSHPRARPIGMAGLARLAATSTRPAVALGGMDARRFTAARRHGAVGWAAIDGWIAD